MHFSPHFWQNQTKLNAVIKIMSLENVKQLLSTIIPSIGIAAILAENIDTNETGFDDDAAKWLKQTNESLKGLIATFPESTVARGYAQTVAFCDNVKNAVLVIIESDQPRPTKLKQCEILLADLSDKTKIWQATKGKDAAYLATTKRDVQTLINSI